MAHRPTKEDREMQAKWDADTLAKAAEISADKARARRAVASAKKTAVQAQKAVKTVAKQARIPRKKK